MQQAYNKTNQREKLYKHVETSQLEEYLKEGILNFYVIENTIEDCGTVNRLTKKYGYTYASTTWINVRELFKIGSTFEDLRKVYEASQ